MFHFYSRTEAVFDPFWRRIFVLFCGREMWLHMSLVNRICPLQSRAAQYIHNCREMGMHIVNIKEL